METMDAEEKRRIATTIARESGNDAARLAALRYLDALDSGEKPVGDGFSALYEVSNPGRIRAKAS